MSENRRSDDRLPVMWEATIIDENDNRWPAFVRDVSTAGALISCEHSFDMDSQLIVEINTLGEFAGQVKWCGDGEIGLFLLVGANLMLKKFTEAGGAGITNQPRNPIDFV